MYELRFLAYQYLHILINLSGIEMKIKEMDIPDENASRQVIMLMDTSGERVWTPYFLTQVYVGEFLYMRHRGLHY